MMTREAKVGLLLGLAFIVAIALVLRGIHQTGQADLDEELLAQNPDDRSGDTVSESVNLSAVSQLTDSDYNTDNDAAPVAVDPRYQTQSPTHDTPPAGVVIRHEPVSAVQNPAPASTDTVYDDTIRHQQSLPTTLDSPRIKPADNTIDRAVENVTTPVADNDMITRAAMIVKPAPHQTYVVADGDSLSSIALKVYGPTEGNRLVNIDRIFDANRKTLKSKDDIYVGQKLTIPALNNQTPSTAAPVLSTPAPKKALSTITYVVKDGDSLWKIAQNKLGNGSRYPEIEKLNQKTLKKRNDLWVGMKLILPQK